MDVSEARRPQQFVCGTQNAIVDSKLSNARFTLNTAIQTDPGSYMGIFSLSKFTFTNTFSNIVAGKNTLKFYSIWYDASASANKLYIRNVVIPAGYYSDLALYNYINAAASELSTFYFGMGTSGDTTLPGFQIATSNPAKLLYTAPSVTVLNTSITANHQYKGFYLKYDDDTKGLMSQLGLVTYSSGAPTNLIERAMPATYSQDGVYTGTTYTSTATKFLSVGIELNVAFTSPSTYTASYISTNGVTCPDYISLGPSNINVCWGAISSGSRDAFNQFNPSNVICAVPVIQPFGYRTCYEPEHPFELYASNFSTTEIHLVILDVFGVEVDFHGIDWEACIELVQVPITRGGVANDYLHPQVNGGIPNLKRRLQ